MLLFLEFDLGFDRTIICERREMSVATFPLVLPIFSALRLSCLEYLCAPMDGPYEQAIRV